MDLAAVIARLEEIAPPDQAEEFDAGRIGLVVEGRSDVRTVCCALDATPFVVDEAVRAGADLLVVHHTPLWNPVTAITGENASLLRSCLGAGLGVYVMHTNYDHALPGINGALASLLDLANPEPLSLGLVGGCTLTPGDISARLGVPVRVWGRTGKISRLAVVGGSGFDPDLIAEAVSAGADAFLSAEMKHAVARRIPIPCIEATHYALEAPGMRALARETGWQFIDDPPVLSVVSP
jgi:dinuclear metal center YbgI/SA1388 family protein